MGRTSDFCHIASHRVDGLPTEGMGAEVAQGTKCLVLEGLSHEADRKRLPGTIRRALANTKSGISAFAVVMTAFDWDFCGARIRSGFSQRYLYEEKIRFRNGMRRIPQAATPILSEMAKDADDLSDFLDHGLIQPGPLIHHPKLTNQTTQDLHIKTVLPLSNPKNPAITPSDADPPAHAVLPSSATIIRANNRTAHSRNIAEASPFHPGDRDLPRL